MRACLLLSRERIKQDKETMEAIVKDAPDDQQRETGMNTIKSLTLIHCLENISVDHTISLLKEKYKVNSLSERNRFLLNYENWPNLLQSKEPELLSYIISSLSERIKEMHKRNIFSIELVDEDFDKLKTNNNNNVDNRFKSDKKEVNVSEKEDEFYNFNSKTSWEELIKQYNDLDPHTKSMLNLIVIGLSIFIISRLLKLLLRIFKRDKTSSKRTGIKKD